MRHLKLFENYSPGWIKLSEKEKSIHSEDLIELVKNAYSGTELGSFVNNEGDVRNSEWVILKDGSIKACIFFRKSRSNENWIGHKIQGIGYENKAKSKLETIRKLKSLLREKGFWIEASDKLEKVLRNGDCKVVRDYNLLEGLFDNTKFIRFFKNGEYYRELEDKVIRETTFGFPVLKN